jgi:2-polyprenyl-3-methyl-5-hydroxy-6-metoxy-1,4-benzoquinol methylase/Flp pilus assembly protein TadD
VNRKERRAAQKRGQPQRTAGAQGLLAQATALAQAGQLYSAEAVCRQYLASHPGDIDAEHLLGRLAFAGGQPGLAVETFNRIGSAKKSAQYACHHAAALAVTGQADEAIDVLKRAAERWPSDLAVATALAAILGDRGRHAEAVTAHRRVVALNPGSAAAHNGLGAALLAAGERAEAARHLLEAMKRAPEVIDTYASVVSTLTMLKPDLMAAAARAHQAWPQRLGLEELVGPDGLKALVADELLLWLLESHTVCDLVLERWLTDLRLALMMAQVQADDDGNEARLQLCCTIARQGFLNDYLFATRLDEDAAAVRLRDDVAAALGSDEPVAAHALAAVAMYFPLGGLPGAEALERGKFAEPLAAVVRQQVTEPRIEAADRAAIPRLTPITLNTSVAVQQQYEESPYPRWVHPAVFQHPATMPVELRRIFKHAAIAGLPENRVLDVLIAGCGTGQHSVEFALAFRDIKITAVDLSLTSLAYARRKTKELRLSNIDYAQADLMELGSIGRMFDAVDASGVLHHLEDPFAGWRLLLGLLRPGGVMRVALYSELARRNVVAGREWVAARGVAATPQQVRRLRHELAAEPKFAPLTKINDFYSVSECRDLLFHVQEHRLTLPAIAAFLAEQKLTLLGLMLTPEVVTAYRRRFPDDPTMTNLDHWHAFETDNPDTFLGMYQFWVEKSA